MQRRELPSFRDISNAISKKLSLGPKISPKAPKLILHSPSIDRTGSLAEITLDDPGNELHRTPNGGNADDKDPIKQVHQTQTKTTGNKAKVGPKPGPPMSPETHEALIAYAAMKVDKSKPGEADPEFLKLLESVAYRTDQDGKPMATPNNRDAWAALSRYNLATDLQMGKDPKENDLIGALNKAMSPNLDPRLEYQATLVAWMDRNKAKTPIVKNTMPIDPNRPRPQEEIAQDIADDHTAQLEELVSQIVERNRARSPRVSKPM